MDKKLYLVAKVIGTETTRVLGATADGKASDDLGPPVEELADAVADVVDKQADKLVPKAAPAADRVAALNEKLKKAPRPALLVGIPERHVGGPAADPAAQTEVSKFAKETGFELVDAGEGGKGKADVPVTGEGFSGVAGRVGGLVSVKARVEVKAVDAALAEQAAGAAFGPQGVGQRVRLGRVLKADVLVPVRPVKGAKGAAVERGATSRSP